MGLSILLVLGVAQAGEYVIEDTGEASDAAYESYIWPDNHAPPYRIDALGLHLRSFGPSKTVEGTIALHVRQDPPILGASAQCEWGFSAEVAAGEVVVLPLEVPIGCRLDSDRIYVASAEVVVLDDGNSVKMQSWAAGAPDLVVAGKGLVPPTTEQRRLWLESSTAPVVEVANGDSPPPEQELLRLHQRLRDARTPAELESATAELEAHKEARR